jgi:REP element-mobilizing transposase RayT
MRGREPFDSAQGRLWATSREGQTLLSASVKVSMFTDHRQLGPILVQILESKSRAADRSVRSTRAMRVPLIHLYEYRRRSPHYQKPDRAIFVTFCKLTPEPFPPAARDLILQHCLYENEKRVDLHVAIVMPEHVHLLLTPLNDATGWPYGLPFILKQIKGVSARSLNKLLGCSGPVWQEEFFDHVLLSNESFEEKREYIRQNPVIRRLSPTPEAYQWLWINPCRADTLVRCL